MTTVRVIGIGSPQGDDSFGWCVLDRLLPHAQCRGWELLKLDRPGPALLASLQEPVPTLLIDAADMGLPPGSLRRFSIAELLAAAEPETCSSHTLGVAQTLALAQACGLSLPPLTLWLAQWQQLEPMGGLSPALGEAAERLADELLQITTQQDLFKK